MLGGGPPNVFATCLLCSEIWVCLSLSRRDLPRYCRLQRWLDGACVLPHRSPLLHRQDDSELCFAAHRSRVRFARFFERICLNHRAHSAEFGEAQCVFLIR